MWQSLAIPTVSRCEMGYHRIAASEYRCEPLGDSYLQLVSLAGDEDEDWLRVHTAYHRLQAMKLDSIISMYAAYRNLLIEYDPERADASTLAAVVGLVMSGLVEDDYAWARSPRTYDIPVTYGWEVMDVAAEVGLSPEAFVELHTSEPLRIRCRGTAGEPMLRNPAACPSVKRRPSPVVRESEVGEIKVAGVQSSLGLAMGMGTTGWRRIGQTAADLTHLGAGGTEANPGDLIRFIPIGINA